VFSTRSEISSEETEPERVRAVVASDMTEQIGGATEEVKRCLGTLKLPASFPTFYIVRVNDLALNKECSLSSAVVRVLRKVSAVSFPFLFIITRGFCLGISCFHLPSSFGERWYSLVENL
jgi:hypothetical protein